MSAKEKMLNFLMKETGRNTFSVAQARSLFGIENVAARIQELRNDGYIIYSNIKRRADGSRVTVYRMGTPKRSFVRAAMQKGVTY